MASHTALEAMCVKELCTKNNKIKLKRLGNGLEVGTKKTHK